ncbi:MAG: hypothetical protein ACLQIJ_23470 [Polyangia bacterium]|jgi:hypothetical protein
MMGKNQGFLPMATQVPSLPFERKILRRSQLKHWFYDHLTGFSAVLLSAGVIFVVAVHAIGAAVLTGVLGLLYFINQHRLNETRLFLELFRDFNQRYDKMADDVHRALGRKQPQPLSPAEEATLVGYFNLCGEELLMFRQGYIHPDAWTAWRLGMNDVFKNQAIRRFWAREGILGSYYGLENLFPVDAEPNEAVDPAAGASA